MLDMIFTVLGKTKWNYTRKKGLLSKEVGTLTNI